MEPHVYIICLCHHWFKNWFVTLQHQDTSWTSNEFWYSLDKNIKQILFFKYIPFHWKKNNLKYRLVFPAQFSTTSRSSICHFLLARTGHSGITFLSFNCRSWLLSQLYDKWLLHIVTERSWCCHFICDHGPHSWLLFGMGFINPIMLSPETINS